MNKQQLSRRLLLSSLALGTAGYLLFKGSEKTIKPYANGTQILLHTAYHLFPVSSLGPGAKDLFISDYLLSVLQDTRIMKVDRDYLLKGAQWLEESAYEEYEKSFLNLDFEQKEALLQKIVGFRWGENFVQNVLNYVFEALLCSPVYGSNPNEIGWKWLEHNPGFPQPKTKEDISYVL